MSTLNKDGMLIDPKVNVQRFNSIEHGALNGVHAIVVHQTDATTARQTLNGYALGHQGVGAHFLIDKNGQIYQTASLSKRCYHIGRLIKSKCLSINPGCCNSADMAKILALSWSRQIKALDALERAKNYPDRYPVNSDSVGIELVGEHIDDNTYETITVQQKDSLMWLVAELYTHFGLSSSDVYRHPEVSYKNPGEASTAVWK